MKYSSSIVLTGIIILGCFINPMFEVKAESLLPTTGIMELCKGNRPVKCEGVIISDFSFEYAYFNKGKYEFVYSSLGSVRKKMDKLVGEIVIFSGNPKVISVERLNKENAVNLYKNSSVPPPIYVYAIDILTIEPIIFFDTKIPDIVNYDKPMNIRLSFKNPFKEKVTFSYILSAKYLSYHDFEGTVQALSGEEKEVEVQLLPADNKRRKELSNAPEQIYLTITGSKDIYIHKNIGSYISGIKE